MAADRDISTERRLIIHCGVQKTGSTSLQHFVQRNREALSPYLDVMTPIKGTPAQVMVRAALGFSNEPTPEKKAHLVEVITQLRGALKDSKVPALISHENLPGAMLGDRGVTTLYPRLEEIIALLDTHLAPLVPEYVFYTREMSDWKRSVYNQAVKTNGYSSLRAVFDAETADCGTWDDLRRRVQAVVGSERVRFFRLEDETNDATPGLQLLRHAGLTEGVIDQMRPIEGRRNPSMNAGALEFLRLVNGLDLDRRVRSKIVDLVKTNQTQFCSDESEGFALDGMALLDTAPESQPESQPETDPVADVKHILRQKGQVAVANKSRHQYLQSFGFSPDVVIDVGVHSGTPLLYRAFPATKFVLIDPRAESEALTLERMAPHDYDFYAVAAGAQEAELDLRIPISDTGENVAMAGFRKVTGPMGRKFTDYDTRKVPVVPLDQIMAKYPGRAGLKIDTEGYELEVLQGARQTLLRADFVIIELSVTPRFEDVAPPSRMIDELADAGLELRDMLRVTGDGRGGPQPRLFDALFTRWEAA